MDRIINVALIAHPMNWVVLTLMVFIAGIAFHVFAGMFSASES